MAVFTPGIMGEDRGHAIEGSTQPGNERVEARLVGGAWLPQDKPERPQDRVWPSRLGVTTRLHQIVKIDAAIRILLDDAAPLSTGGTGSLQAVAQDNATNLRRKRAEP